MTREEMVERTKNFALRIIHLVTKLPNRRRTSSRTSASTVWYFNRRKLSRGGAIGN